MSSSNLAYRPEIDGLRALAVVSVILYHAKITVLGKDWFDGGYIGVDVFFVISGYLISRIIFYELKETDKFDFINFYERRARRILPVLFVVVFSSVPFAWYTMLPTQLLDYAQSILGSIFFASNIVFYFTTTEYGAESALIKPFLHTWSLAVEEQFYIIFPMIFIISFRLIRNHLFIVLFIVSMLALQFAEIMADRNPDLNFYMPLSRFWELATGSMLAYREVFHKSNCGPKWQGVLPCVGLIVVVLSIFSFNAETPHPSYYTLIPVLGVAAAIGTGPAECFVHKTLGNPIFVRLGIVSYSAYMWHYPIFAFARLEWGEPTNTWKLLLILVTAMLSAFTYSIVEKPFRNRKRISSRLFWITTSICMIATCSLVGAVYHFNGFPARIPLGWQNFQPDAGVLQKTFWNVYWKNKDQLSTPSDTKTNVYVFGNSHSSDFLSALMLRGSHYDEFHFLKSERYEQIGCFDESDDRFEEQRKKFYDSQTYKAAEIIILATRFSNVYCDKSVEKGHADDLGLKYFIPRLLSDGKRVIIIGNTAFIGQINGKTVADHIFLQAQNASIDFSSKSTFEVYKRRAEEIAFSNLDWENVEKNRRLEAFARENGLSYFDRMPLFCNFTARTCAVFTDNGYKIRYDYGHLTDQGREYFADELLKSDFPNVLSELARGRNGQ